MYSALRKEIEATLATLATPIDDGTPCRAYLGTAEGPINYQAYFARDGGRRREYFGPVFNSPRDCSRFVDQVNARSGLATATQEVPA